MQVDFRTNEGGDLVAADVHGNMLQGLKIPIIQIQVLYRNFNGSGIRLRRRSHGFPLSFRL